MEQLSTKEQVLQVKKEHPDWGVVKISEHLSIPQGTAGFHLYSESKRKSVKKYRTKNPLIKKLMDFNWSSKKNETYKEKISFSHIELREKIGNSPKCYLTGYHIDLNKTHTYHLDHIIPVSKGGDNSLNNCNIACKAANQAKSDKTPEEFFKLCSDVLVYNGYIVVPPEKNTGSQDYCI